MLVCKVIPIVYFINLADLTSFRRTYQLHCSSCVNVYHTVHTCMHYYSQRLHVKTDKHRFLIAINEQWFAYAIKQYNFREIVVSNITVPFLGLHRAHSLGNGAKYRTNTLWS